ncbi:MAG TPA: peptidoglycan DD-metalloendopeptidase family protein [Kiloniellales bacterium]|jgi:murein DD-endopeptidase MepM/ murein hydrolase activator NlpD|nr:peptidoglycan DD-metalloendopeptidase family protein [Kiloniellales bacterium]
MIYLRSFAVLLIIALMAASCSNPERVRVASAPLPPLPRAKPMDLAGGSVGPMASVPTSEVEVTAIGEAPAASPATSPPAASPGDTAAPLQPEAAGGEGEASRLVRPAESSYVVQAGDTLFSISQRFEVPLAAMIDANGLNAPFELRVGQPLTIPSVRVYEVRSGETLEDIAARQGVSTAQLAQANRLEAPYRLWGGQRLVLPGTVADEPIGEVDVTLAEAAAAAAPAGEVADPAEPLPTQEVEELALPPEEDVSQPPETATPPADTQAEPSEPAPVAAVPSPPPRSGGRFLWPLQGEQVAAFGPQGDGRHNDGINIAAARGTTVVAAENGVVAYAGNELRGFGNLLLIKHSDDWITAYAHNDRLLVSAGDSVTRGQAIAEVGATGSVAQPQLHFEIRKGTRAVDPMPLLEGTGGG